MSGDFYVINKSPDTIGLKTNTDGPALFFTTTGDDKPNYSLVTNYRQETATVRRSQVTIQTTEDHGLEEKDRFDLIVKTGLTTGIGTSTRATVKLIDGYTIINPLDIPTIKQVLNINSRFRENYNTTLATDFIHRLPETIKKVAEIKEITVEEVTNITT